MEHSGEDFVPMLRESDLEKQLARALQLFNAHKDKSRLLVLSKKRKIALIKKPLMEVYGLLKKVAFTGRQASV